MNQDDEDDFQDEDNQGDDNQDEGDEQSDSSKTRLNAVRPVGDKASGSNR